MKKIHLIFGVCVVLAFLLTGQYMDKFYNHLDGALELGLLTGTPVYVLKNNKIVDLTKEQKPSKNQSQRVKDGNQMNTINVREKLSLIHDYWNPRIVSELNGQYVKLVKFQGPFAWHHHENEDELFMVVNGRFKMEYRDDAGEQSTWVNEGELIVVPRGVEHRPVADQECHVLLFEPVSTLNTGNVEHELTRRELSRI